MKAGVDRAYDKVKMFQHFFVIVETSVRQDIAFNTLEYVKILFPSVEGIDNLPLAVEVLNLEAACVVGTFTLI